MRYLSPSDRRFIKGAVFTVLAVLAVVGAVFVLQSAQLLQAALVEPRLVALQLPVDVLAPLHQALDRDRDAGQLPDDPGGAADAAGADQQLDALHDGHANAAQLVPETHAYR